MTRIPHEMGPAKRRAPCDDTDTFYCDPPSRFAATDVPVQTALDLMYAYFDATEGHWPPSAVGRRERSVSGTT